MKKYFIRTSMNFSISEKEFCLVQGETIELPPHELIDSLLIRGHISEVVEEQKIEEPDSKKNIKNK